MAEKLPHMTINPARPGAIMFDGDPMTGMLAGMRSRDIARACNAYAPMLDALQFAADFLVGEYAQVTDPDRRAGWSDKAAYENYKAIKAAMAVE